MRKVGLALIAVTTVLLFTAPMANAGALLNCTYVKSLCPQGTPPQGDGNHHHHNVPEPASMMLLGAGVAAVGAAVARRRRKNNTDK